MGLHFEKLSLYFQSVPMKSLSFMASFFLAIFLNSGTALGSGGPPMITDDPGTPGDGNWEINIASLSSHNSAATTYQLPLIDVNYGIGDRLQLKLEMPWLFQIEKNGSHLSSVGNGLAGMKWRFYDTGENGWQVSTYPQVEFGFPDVKQNGLLDKGTSYLLPMEFVRGFDGFDINFEVGRWLRPTHQGDTWITGVVVTHEVRKGFEVLAEIHDEVSVHQSLGESVLNIGARWDLSDRYTLLVSAGHDLQNNFGRMNTLLTYLGFQMRY